MSRLPIGPGSGRPARWRGVLRRISQPITARWPVNKNHLLNRKIHLMILWPGTCAVRPNTPADLGSRPVPLCRRDVRPAGDSVVEFDAEAVEDAGDHEVE